MKPLAGNGVIYTTDLNLKWSIRKNDPEGFLLPTIQGREKYVAAVTGPPQDMFGWLEPLRYAEC